MQKGSLAAALFAYCSFSARWRVDKGTLTCTRKGCEAAQKAGMR